MRVGVEWEHLDLNERVLGNLPGASSGSVTRSAASSIKASAKLKMRDVASVDWLTSRVRPVLTVDGVRIPLGVFLPDVPSVSYDNLGRGGSVTLLSKEAILDDDSFGRTFGVASGTGVTIAVKDVIESTGEPARGIEDGDGQTLRSGIEWEPQDSKLQVVNDLLSAANYFSLSSDGNGNFVARKYKAPSRRTVAAELEDSQGVEMISRYLPSFEVERDVGRIPNRVRAVSQSEEDTEALVAEAENTNPEDPFSFPSRGRWITEVEMGVKTTSQQAMQEYAGRRLTELSSVQETVVVQSPPSVLTINDVVRFASRLHNLDGLYSVQKQEIDLSFNGLMKMTLQRVVES